MSLLILLNILQFYGLRRNPTFSKNYQIIVVFLLKKSIQTSENWSFALKIVFFYSKRPPRIAKKWILHTKITKKWEKKGTKKTSQPRKSWRFSWKKLSFFTQKYLPASQKTEFLNEKMTQKCHKRYQKEHPARQKLLSFAWKIENRPTFGD